MFWKSDAKKELDKTMVLKEKLEEDNEKLEKGVKNLKAELESLKLKKKIEEEDIKHMVKIKVEENDLAHQKKVLETEAERDREIAKVKDDYRDKAEAQLRTETERIMGMYKEILTRLPDVNVMLGDRGAKDGEDKG